MWGEGQELRPCPPPHPPPNPHKGACKSEPIDTMLLQKAMDDQKLKKLKQCYNSISNQKDLFYRKGGRIENLEFNMLENTINKVRDECPGILPLFRRDDFAVDDLLGGYDINSIRVYLAQSEGLLRGAIDESSRSYNVEERDFSFVSDPKFKKILQRDFLEIQLAYQASCWKSTIILCGGGIEAILTDLLITKETLAKASAKAPNKPDITRWDLSELINVAVDLKLVTAAVEKLSHPIREYRNLVHPGNEIRSKLTFGAEEAKIALEVFNIVYRDLNP
jgi:hypothetical protein